MVLGETSINLLHIYTEGTLVMKNGAWWSSVEYIAAFG